MTQMIRNKKGIYNDDNNKMIYIIQNNVTSEIIDELNFIHNHSLIKVAKMHDQLEYLKCQQKRK